MPPHVRDPVPRPAAAGIAPRGTVRLPGSKSISNRVLLLAGLARRHDRVHDLLDSDDTRVMLDALRALGCGVDARRRRACAITGLGGRLAVPRRRPLPRQRRHRDAAADRRAGGARRHAGRRVRAARRAAHARAARSATWSTRCASSAAASTTWAATAIPPLRLARRRDRSSLDAPIRVRGDVSSQFLTALLLALPLVAADGAIAIEVEGELISKPYIEITLKLLARFGITGARRGWQRFTIPRGSRYASPGEIHVEGDASSASYFVALGAIAAADAPRAHRGRRARTRSRATCASSTPRGPWARSVSGGADWLEVRRGALAAQAPSTLDCNHIPDAAMTLAVMALYAAAPRG